MSGSSPNVFKRLKAVEVAVRRAWGRRGIVEE
jgi:hypothetical protein